MSNMSEYDSMMMTVENQKAGSNCFLESAIYNTYAACIFISGIILRGRICFQNCQHK